MIADFQSFTIFCSAIQHLNSLTRTGDSSFLQYLIILTEKSQFPEEEEELSDSINLVTSSTLVSRNENSLLGTFITLSFLRFLKFSFIKLSEQEFLI